LYCTEEALSKNFVSKQEIPFFEKMVFLKIGKKVGKIVNNFKQFINYHFKLDRIS